MSAHVDGPGMTSRVYLSVCLYALVLGGSGGCFVDVGEGVNRLCSVAHPCPTSLWCDVGRCQPGCDTSPPTALRAWRAARPLPSPRWNAAAVAVDNNIFVFGGCNQLRPCTAPLDEVLRARVGSDGTLSEWRALRPLPAPVSGAAAVAVGNRIYVVGGGSMWHAAVRSDGELGDWATGPSLLFARDEPALTGTFRALLVVGGLWNGQPIASTERLLISPDGPQGTWERALDIGGGRAAAFGFTSQGAVHVVGGMGSGPRALSDVQRSGIQESATLQGFGTVGSLPEGLADVAGTRAGCQVLLAGGWREPGQSRRNVYTAALDGNDGLSAWVAGDDLAAALSAAGAVAIGSRVYVIGGERLDPATGVVSVTAETLIAELR